MVRKTTRKTTSRRKTASRTATRKSATTRRKTTRKPTTRTQPTKVVYVYTAQSKKPQTRKGVAKDKKLTALAPGKRVSYKFKKSGSVYYERRPNRSDVNKRTRL